MDVTDLKKQRAAEAEALKQKVLDAVVNLADAQLSPNDYLHFLTQVEAAVCDRINQLAASEINHLTGHGPGREPEPEPATACCGFSCGVACVKEN